MYKVEKAVYYADRWMDGWMHQVDKAMSPSVSCFLFPESATRFVDWQIARFLTPRDTPFSQIDKDSSEEATARGGGGGGGGKRDVCAIVLGFQLNRDGSPHAILRYRMQ